VRPGAELRSVRAFAGGCAVSNEKTLREAAQNALIVMESLAGEYSDAGLKAVVDLRAALAQPAPVAQPLHITSEMAHAAASEWDGC